VKEIVYEELEHAFDKFPQLHMNYLLEDFNAKISREDIKKSQLEIRGYTKLE
jgi:hypothetical protein